jgi:hypothetical protein
MALVKKQEVLAPQSPSSPLAQPQALEAKLEQKPLGLAMAEMLLGPCSSPESRAFSLQQVLSDPLCLEFTRALEVLVARQSLL